MSFALQKLVISLILKFLIKKTINTLIAPLIPASELFLTRDLTIDMNI